MIIAIDIDEVLGDFLSSFIKYHNDKYQTSMITDDFVTYDFSKVMNYSKDEAYKRIDEFMGSEDFKNIPTIEGSKEAIEILKKNHKLHIVTARPKFIAEKTQEWIDRNFPDAFEKIHFAYSVYRNPSDSFTKSEICKNIGSDVFIEDMPEYAIEASVNVPQVFLVDRLWNKNSSLPKNVKKVFSWREIVERIEEL
ncbi:MAG: hypothetical protein WCW87_00810 [Candidatus Paceibacterota bacterium]